MSASAPQRPMHSNIDCFCRELPASGSENWPHKLEACVAIMEISCGGGKIELALEQLIQDQCIAYQAEKALTK